MALTLSLAACDADLTGEDSALRVVPDATTYLRDATLGTADIGFTVLNRGTTIVYLARCGDRLLAAVDHWVTGGWTQQSGDGCLTIYDGSPLEVQPGQTLHSLRVLHAEPGRYRLRLGASEAPTVSAAWTATSDDFRVR
ncbi:MAG: hypothetical protein ACRELD_07955 [Longimicrobiales bacterium]